MFNVIMFFLLITSLMWLIGAFFGLIECFDANYIITGWVYKLSLVLPLLLTITLTNTIGVPSVTRTSKTECVCIHKCN